MIRLDEGLWLWSAFDAEKLYNFNGFLVQADGACLVIDPPELSASDQGFYDRLGLRPDLVVITNRNHLRARERFAQGGRTPTAMHEAEILEVGLSVERAVVDGDRLPGGLVAVHLPGKSPGEIALYWPARETLIVGDALIAPNGRLALVPTAKQDDPPLLRRSLERLRGLQFDALLVADGDPILRGAKRRVEEFLDGLEPA